MSMRATIVRMASSSSPSQMASRPRAMARSTFWAVSVQTCSTPAVRAASVFLAHALDQHGLGKKAQQQRRNQIAQQHDGDHLEAQGMGAAPVRRLGLNSVGCFIVSSSDRFVTALTGYRYASKGRPTKSAMVPTRVLAWWMVSSSAKMRMRASVPEKRTITQAFSKYTLQPSR